MNGSSQMTQDKVLNAYELRIENSNDEDLYNLFHTEKNKHAFQSLIQRHQSRSYHLAFSMSGQASVAEEAVQEAFLHLLRFNCSFRPTGPGSFIKWFNSVVANQTKNILRREKRLKKRHRSQINLDNSSTNGEQHGTEILNQEIQSALINLNDDVRQSILLFYAEGMSQEEIGKLLGLSQSVVSRRITGGLKKIRKQLTGNNAAVSLTALAELLRDQWQPVQVPNNLESSLNILSDQFGASGKLLDAPQTDSASTNLFAGYLAPLALITIAAITAFGFVFLWQEKPEEPEVSPQQQPKNTISYSWNFDEPAPEGTKGLDFFKGKWEWEPEGAMSFYQEMAYIKLPEMTDFPLIIEIDSSGARAFFGLAFLDDSGEFVPYIFEGVAKDFKLPKGPSAGRTFLFLVMENNKIIQFEKQDGHISFTAKNLYKFLSPIHDKRMVLASKNAKMDSLEIRIPGSTEIQNLTALGNQIPPATFPKETGFDYVNHFPDWLSYESESSAVKPVKIIHRKDSAGNKTGNCISVNDPCLFSPIPVVKQTPCLMEFEIQFHPGGTHKIMSSWMQPSRKNPFGLSSPKEFKSKAIPPTSSLGRIKINDWTRCAIYYFDHTVIITINGEPIRKTTYPNSKPIGKNIFLNLADCNIDNLSIRYINQNEVPKSVTIHLE